MSITTPFPTARHNHASCVTSALADANNYCQQHGLRLTKLRRQVFELVWASHQPVGAYELLQKLTVARGKQIAPPTIYRSLDFLLKHGLIHRIASHNAYVGCTQPGGQHDSTFFICRQCHLTAEIEQPKLEQLIKHDARHLGFKIDSQTLEISGLCADCQQAAP